jgi:hypothetical protein
MSLAKLSYIEKANNSDAKLFLQADLPAAVRLSQTLNVTLMQKVRAYALNAALLQRYSQAALDNAAELLTEAALPEARRSVPTLSVTISRSREHPSAN